jgi:phospholipase C
MNPLRAPVFVACAALTGCAADPDPETAADAAPTTTEEAPFVPRTVFTILLENHDYAEVIGSPDAPYINDLAARFGLATNYTDSGTHPSLPNYLALISGDTQYPSLGFLEYDPTIFPFPLDADNLGSQLTAAGIPWRSYQESMGAPCTTSSHGRFAARHDPFLYFDDIQNGEDDLCRKTNVDYAAFDDDLATNAYRYLWITPNLDDDGHDPPSDPARGLRQSDAWLSTEVPKILASRAWRDGGVLFITWDEAEGRDGHSRDQVPMIVVAPHVRPGFTSDAPYGHASYLATVEAIFGLPKLGAAASAATMEGFWR